MNSVQGLVIIITGGAQGIGRGCSLKFVQKGAHVICGVHIDIILSYQGY